MLAKYYHYNHVDPSVEQFIIRINESMHRNYASKLLGSLLNSTEFDMENSVKKTIAVFRLTGIPVQEHISEIYRSDGIKIRKDWKLSELACSLVILVSESSHYNVKTGKDNLLDYLGL